MSRNIQLCFERYEKKYLINTEKQKEFIDLISEYIKPDAYPEYEISNIYYDTPNRALIRASIEKPAFKEKLRVRSYGRVNDGDKVFIEMKRKYNGIVYKRRITADINDIDSILDPDSELKESSQISRELKSFQRQYRSKPMTYINYKRKAFSGIDDERLRITFDTDINCRDYGLDLRNGESGVLLLDKNTVLMEIKIPGVCPLYLSRALSQLQIYPVSFSKYGYYYKNFILKTEDDLLA